MKIIFILLVFVMSAHSQSNSQPQPASADSRFASELFNSYGEYAFAPMTSRHFKHAELLSYLETMKTLLGPLMSTEQVGISAEGRSINLVKIGTGPTKVFLWSQMHGDEPTATMALFDVMNYIGKNRNSVEVKNILSQTTLLIIPMVNPDGAERFQRRTWQGIDMNRDAVRLQTPEAKILKSVRDTYTPEIGFNLHDQDPRYTVGETGQVSTIALLAPAYNVAKEDNVVRTRAKQLTATIANTLRQFIPDNISRYDDTFEPRAFGDNIQKWGTSTILIESGGWKDDPQKMFIRKLNYVALLSVFNAIASRSYEKTSLTDYERIPFNTRNLYDMIITKTTLKFPDARPSLTADIGINYEEIRDANGIFQQRARVVDIGDLSVFFAHDTLDGTGKTIDGSLVELNDIVTLDDIRKALSR